MIKKYEVLSKIEQEKIVAIVREKDEESAFKCFQALYDGGIRVVELAFTTPYAHSILETLSKKFGDKMLIGAGTVLDEATCRIAILSGAKFMVTPTLNENVIKTCNRYGVPCLSGVATATEALKALENGVDVVKLFPANSFNFDIIKSLKAPLPNLCVLPTGGVGLDNAKEWLNAGAFALGVGGELVKGAKTGDYKLVTETAKKFIEAVK